ncbi:flagellar basal-body rod protein FlgF [Psychrosphaera sp. B3R10]|uniref:Flagellar basal-body rod protein FlgF n=1 Tax=Psychrosphaera algicola TaxID=3023714 RepID=A0ABT5F9V6_9GAMM|nr:MULTISPECIES: flagellar basal-body rod protein FlgF [unclassified Psychrosphaera]MBU2884073.1 flagellar basal-body rod protein FlgF [Psychrosphaera sp. I2R16]MBU2988203.1 flagellar basal-body rod protein FlgF [Psychrosphaera sp. B3R10]MDC2888312.1 flagellar basal-body rod protein FlgF [Psychrosphaera sp. G1-22]MDO6718412.1 flagellar basal-body rod protein FlgF [Psychrosphaera sp. 1_MG-2023]
MDKMLYVAMSGAKQNLIGVSMNANNLANAKTAGFRADFEQQRSMQAFGEGHPTRVFAVTERPGSKMNHGSIATTGRDLDIAIKGDGMLAVQDRTGSEAYTREGNLQITKEGLLTTARGAPVMGEGGPIVIPLPIEKIEIGPDGSVTIRPSGAPANFLETVDRIKLIEPPSLNSMTKGNDGLFRSKESVLTNDLCGFCDASPNIGIESGALELSNVSPVSEMTAMIAHQRQYELQIKLMKKAEEIDRAQDQLLRIF